MQSVDNHKKEHSENKIVQSFMFENEVEPGVLQSSVQKNIRGAKMPLRVFDFVPVVWHFCRTRVC